MSPDQVGRAGAVPGGLDISSCCTICCNVYSACLPACTYFRPTAPTAVTARPPNQFVSATPLLRCRFAEVWEAYIALERSARRTKVRPHEA